MGKERSREVTVQHVLLSTKQEALDVYEELLSSGGSSIDVLAQTKSLCGSGKKRPEANLAQLRGAPGELQFRKGQMLPPFEKLAFEAPLQVVQAPFQTQEGWHVMVVNQRTGDEEDTAAHASISSVSNDNEDDNNNAAASSSLGATSENSRNNAVKSTKKKRGKSKKKKDRFKK